MSVSEAFVSSFLPFAQLYISHSRIGRTSRFTSLYFGSTHDFTIACNSQEFFSSSQNTGPRLAGRMTTIDTYVVVFSRPAQYQVLKRFPMVGIGVDYGNQVCPISLHLWNIYLLPLELAGLECDPHHVSFRLPFPNRTQNFLIVPILFSGKFCQGMHYRVAGVSGMTD